MDEIGQISPTDFIRIAEERDLISQLGEIILDKAFQFRDSLKAQGYFGLYVSVNISIQQLLRDDYVDSVNRLVSIYLKNRNYLMLEFTESVIIQNFAVVNQKLKELRQLGVTVAMDDFGTGYSSLAELRHLNVDLVKIDKKFVDHIGQTDRESLITPDVISMSHKLNMIVIAEGVEKKAQLQFLKEHGCDIVQGFYISRPLKDVEAIALLRDFSIEA